jgi:hypothetical protein
MTLARQDYASGAWGAQTPFTGLQAYPLQPALVAMDLGPKDLMLAYVGSDLLIHSTTRDRTTKAWGIPVLVDTTASTTDPPELAPMPGGRAMLIWKASNEQAYFSVYDPATMLWAPPKELVQGKNPAVANTPSVVEGHCGSDATSAFVDKATGNVSVLRYVNGAWLGPYAVPGMTKMTFAGAGELL